MTLRTTVKALLGTALGAPVVIAIGVWVRVLLGAMGDGAGVAAVDRICLAIGVVWLAAVVSLVVALAAVYLNSSADEPTEQPPPAPAKAGKRSPRSGKSSSN